MVAAVRTAIVTGGGSGIGKATVAVLARAGLQVVSVGRDGDKLEAARAEVADRAAAIEVCPADVTRREGREQVLRLCRRRFGGVDVLVNCATVTALEPLLDYAESSWREVVAINLDACFFLAQMAIEDMRGREWGRIVNVGSVYGKVGLDNSLYGGVLAEDADGRGPVREVAYSAAKGAIAQLTRELAVACARWGITVNSVVPGMFPADPESGSEDMRSALLARIPLHRFGRPEEVGHAIEFLASDRAAYITGSEIVVDGGFTAI